MLAWAALLAAAAGLAFAARGAPADSPDASVDNAGAAGAKALFTYLSERGRDVRALRGSLAGLGTSGTLVIAAPTQRPISKEELEAIQAFVSGGGRLVYLAPRTPPGRMERWLGLERGAALPATGPEAGEDPTGATLQVWSATGALPAGARLRASADLGLRTNDARAVPVAGSGDAVAVLRYSIDQGDVWALAGPELIQNRRISLLDNLELWEGLAAQGPVFFDELHFARAPRPPLSPGLAAFALQLAACALLLAAARGTRFGWPRAPFHERHRATREYLEAMASLTRRARVERELAAELLSRLRARLNDRLGISPALELLDADALLAQRVGLPPGELASLVPHGRLGPREYARMARRAARLERLLANRRYAR
jgi:hypothetical protein